MEQWFARLGIWEVGLAHAPACKNKVAYFCLLRMKQMAESEGEEE